MAKNRVIGKDNQLPWHFSCDLKHFKETTSGSTVIMGRKTYESIGRPLPNRENFVLSRNAPLLKARKDVIARERSNRSNPKKPSVKWFTSFESALQEVKTEKAFVIGGANIYEQTMDKVDGIYATMIDAEYEGDAFYPEIPGVFQKKDKWTLQKSGPAIEVIYYER